MLSVKKIKYNNLTNLDFDVLCDVSFDDDNGDVSSFLNREAVKSESYNGKFTNVYQYRYTDVLSPTITFVKDNFEEFTVNEQRRIYAWLTSKQTASAMDLYDINDNEEITVLCSLIGAFTEISTYKISNNRVIGIVAVFENIFPWALSPIQTITNSIYEPTTLKIKCHSDEANELVYPKITITQNSTVIVPASHAMIYPAEHISGTVYKYDDLYYWINSTGEHHFYEEENTSNINTTSVIINNLTTNTQTIIKNNVANEIITIDGANRVIYTNSQSRGIFGDDFNWNWCGFKQGLNELSIMGNCVIRFDWREPMKVGEW